MQLNEERVMKLAHRIADTGVTDRHRRRTQQTYRTVFRVETNEKSGRKHLDLIFKRIIKARSTQLSTDRYYDLIERVSPEAVITAESRKEAFDRLRSHPQIGQKIANEFLRHVVDVFGIRRDEWRDELHVALDVNVVQALIKTGAIEFDEDEQHRATSLNKILNDNPESDPHIRIGYQDIQDVFQSAANRAGFSRIVFDELWLEHREFISDPLLQEKSIFHDDLILDEYLVSPR